MADHPKIPLRSPGLPAERHSHPWIHISALSTPDEAIPDGALVAVTAPRSGHAVAIGYLNRRSQWAVRILTRDVRESIDASWFGLRLAQAAELRRRLGADAEACRLVNSEADGLPGLVVDRYGPLLVAQCLTLGMERQRPLWTEALGALFPGAPLYERSEGAGRAREGLDPRTGWVTPPVGAIDLPVRIREGAVLLEADPRTGQKTGLYLDQRVNRQMAAPLLAGGTLLDVFAYHGGFALHALKAGAQQACLVDLSADALSAARRNAEVNGLADRCRFAPANAFDFLHDRAAAGDQFDGIVLDPPAFSRGRGSVDPAWRGYKEINLRALQMLGAGGTLVTCSCSHHFGRGLFLEMLNAAARDARAQLQIVYCLGAAPDHPTLAGMPESEYLVCVVARAWPWAARRRRPRRTQSASAAPPAGEPPPAPAQQPLM